MEDAPQGAEVGWGGFVVRQFAGEGLYVVAQNVRSARLTGQQHAIEQAVQLKETLGGEVIALSMGIPATERLLRDAVSRGADRAVLLSDKRFAGADTLATSYTLALGIKKFGPVDLILCGKMAVDGDTAQIGPELAEQLDVPHVTDVSRIISIMDGMVICDKTTDTGSQTLRVKLPALLTVMKDINMPRMPSIDGVFQGLATPVQVLDAEALGADPARIGLSGSPTQVKRTYVPTSRGESVTFEGNPEEQAEQILKRVGEVLADGGI